MYKCFQFNTLIPIYGLLLTKPGSLTGHSPPLDDEGVFLEALPLVADVLLATAPLLDEGVLPLPLLPPPPVEFGVFLCAGLYSGSESSSELRSSDESSGLRRTKKVWLTNCFGHLFNNKPYLYIDYTYTLHLTPYTLHLQMDLTDSRV